MIRRCVCVCLGPDGKAVRSKYDPFHTLLQRAQEDPSWPSEGPGFDPLAAAFQASNALLVTGCMQLACNSGVFLHLTLWKPPIPSCLQSLSRSLVQSLSMHCASIH